MSGHVVPFRHYRPGFPRHIYPQQGPRPCCTKNRTGVLLIKHIRERITAPAHISRAKIDTSYSVKEALLHSVDALQILDANLLIFAVDADEFTKKKKKRRQNLVQIVYFRMDVLLQGKCSQVEQMSVHLIKCCLLSSSLLIASNIQ